MVLKKCSGRIWNNSIQLKKEKRRISPSHSCFSVYTDLDHFTFLFCRGCMVKKCRKIYKAHAQLLFWALNVLLGDILVPSINKTSTSIHANIGPGKAYKR